VICRADVCEDTKRNWAGADGRSHGTELGRCDADEPLIKGFVRIRFLTMCDVVGNSITDSGVFFCKNGPLCNANVFAFLISFCVQTLSGMVFSCATLSKLFARLDFADQLRKEFT
jgi:hypothetical protein